MNWDAIGAIGQVLGSIAVFATLGYLAVQVRHAKEEVRRSISQGRIQAARELSSSRANNDRLASIRVKAYANLGLERPEWVASLLTQLGLTLDEWFIVNHDIQAWWTYRTQVIPFISELPEGERLEFESGTRAFFTEPINRLWYDRFKAGLYPEAVRYIDNLLAQPG